MLKPCSLLFAAFAVVGVASAQFDDGGGGGQRRSPFDPPNASLKYAPDRTCDLLNIAVDIDVDYPNRTIVGKSVNTMSPLRSGITEVILNASPEMTITNILVDGQTAKYTREERNLHIQTAPLTKGKVINIEVDYTIKNSRGRSFGGGEGGWHWIEPGDTGNKDRVGFWTQGESHYNSGWAPTWDYPNDLTTSETRCTVDADWDVVGNGKLVSTKLSSDKKRKTFDWKMTQPHATYLLSLVGGPFDIKKDKWEGVDLWYVVPKGEGALIDESFGHTKDMLSFYSKITGVKYAWPKYAQDAMFDFGGGMENVSCTTLQESALTDAKDGWYNMDSLNSHELGHQWFGDLVTCMFWGDTWLNESFATYMQFMYFEHSRGKDAYDWEVEDAMRSYFNEARRYHRPISTHMYPNDDIMFDQHTYPKGGVVLHTLRKQLGDEAFFGALNYYLTKWRHTPVESAQLRRAFTESTGINAEPFWAQWFDKPGHPVIDYTWTYDAGKVKLTVRQTQDTRDGTPIYDIPAKVDLISTTGEHTVLPVHLTYANQVFDLPAATKPGAVVFDPEHEFLREIPTLHWSSEELPLILKYGKNAPDRFNAMQRLLQNASDETIQMVADVVAKDTDREPAFRSVIPLVGTDKAFLRPFWIKELDHASTSIQAQAAAALGRLPADPATTTKLRSLIDDKSSTSVVVNAINALANWDAKANADVFKKAQGIKDHRGAIKRAADRALAKATG